MKSIRFPLQEHLCSCSTRSFVLVFSEFGKPKIFLGFPFHFPLMSLLPFNFFHALLVFFGFPSFPALSFRSLIKSDADFLHKWKHGDEALKYGQWGQPLGRKIDKEKRNDNVIAFKSRRGFSNSMLPHTSRVKRRN